MVMGIKVMAFSIAAFAGITMAVQGTMNSSMGKTIGLLPTTLVVNAIGFLLVGILLFGFRLEKVQWSAFGQVPWYLYLGGVLGVIITYGVIHSMPKIGVAPATTAIILGQVFTAVIIDHFGIFGMHKLPFNWLRIVGTVLMAGGAWFLLKE